MAPVSRAIRIASLQLGPISIEAGIHGAVDDEGAGLVSLCTHGDSKDQAPSKIKRRDYCPTCDNDSKATFRKGKEVGGAVVLLDPDALLALAEADEAMAKRIELTVHPAAEMGRAFPTGKSYYLAPRKGAENRYALMARLMDKRPDLAFVGEFSFGGPPALYQVIEAEGVMVMRQLARPELVRDRPAMAGEVNEKWLGMAEQWADMICAGYDPAAYADKRAVALAKLVDDGVPIIPSGEATPVGGGDLGAAFEAAMAAMAPPAPVAPARPRRTRKGAATPIAS